MADVVDVAEYILAKQGEMSAMRLQRLVYYSQAWHLAWEGRPLFRARIEAWANGPVVPALYGLHKGYSTIQAGFFYQRRETLRRRKALKRALLVHPPVR